MAIERPAPSRRTLTLILIPIFLVIASGYAGQAFFPTLLADHPLALVALEPRNRNLVLVAAQLALGPFLIIAVIRRMISDPLFYLLGHLYGDGGVRWVERKMGEAGFMVTALERWFKRFGPLMVFAFPGAIICTLAGATGMNFAFFIALNLAGTVAMVLLLREFGEFFDGPVQGLTGFISRYSWQLTVVSVLITAWYIWDERRRGKSAIGSIDEIEGEIEKKN